ncbi:MAG: PAS-domain containing protein [Hyphomicrobiaceae bacterium]|nr:PAS-domain containing protein [Hyphomicrobiaceae bacterium]
MPDELTRVDDWQFGARGAEEHSRDGAALAQSLATLGSSLWSGKAFTAVASGEESERHLEESARQAVRLRFLLVILVLSLVLLAAFSAYRYLELENRLAARVPENTIWSAAQTEIELYRLLNALDDFSHDGRTGDRDRLQLQFEILGSRADLYRDGVLREVAMANPDSRAIIGDFLATLTRIEPRIAALKVDDRQEAEGLRRELARFSQPLRRVGLMSLEADRQEREIFNASQTQMRNQLILFGVGAVIATLLLFAFFGRSEWIARLGLANMLKARAEADAARRQLAEAIENISEGFVMYDAEDRLVLCNSKYREIYALSAPAMVPGATFTEILRYGARRGQYEGALEDAEAWIANRLEQRKRMVPYEQALNDERWLMVSDRRTADGGLVGIRTDITELKRREVELAEAKERGEKQAAQMRELATEAQRANRMKSEFLAMISHEIRTPMNAIIGLSDLLAETRLDANQARFLRNITDSGVRLLGVIDDILDFSQIEAGKLQLNAAPFEPRETLRAATDLMRVLADGKGLRLTTSVDPNLPQVLIGDAGRVHQVLVNLLGNAVKYTRQGEVHAAITVASRDAHSARVVLSVADTGPGIGPELRERLFKPFERGEDARSGPQSGTGLGLALTKRLVDLMNGTIEVESEPGAGSLFRVTVTLSIGEAPEVDAGATRQRGSGLPGLDILVAEDMIANQMVVREMLERRHHRVTIVDDGAQAVARAAKVRYDFILLDLQMPVMDGLSAVRAIRASVGPNAHAPIMALSAQAQASDRETAAQAGFDGYLTKPLRVVDLDGIVDQIAARRQAAAQATPAALPVEETPAVVGIDRDALREMIDSLGQATFARLFGRFLDDVEKRLVALTEAVANDAGVEIAQITHSMAGLTSQFGLVDVAAKCAKVERMSDRIDQRVEAMTLVEETRIAVEHLRGIVSGA